MLNDEVLYTARKYPPASWAMACARSAICWPRTTQALQSRGLSPAAVTVDRDTSLDVVLPKGERWDIPGRMNLSAGGTMVLEAPRSDAALTQARKAVRALGLRVAAVDLFTDIGGDPDAIRVIEVNSNPSIRLLEQSEPQRPDPENLASHIFRHGIAGS